ncbi:MAG: Fe-S cluster assembly protein SufD [Planctomycetes bacterium]|nr:Fe-S cluster assembly protein SufD [Planctomycetota bacterium]
MTSTMTETGTFTAAFTALDPASPAHALRSPAWERFGATGLPTPREERWRYTNVKPIASTTFAAPHDARNDVSHDDIEPYRLGDGPRLVFVNGHFAPTLSRIPEHAGARVASLAETIADDFAAVEPHLGGAVSYDDDGFLHLNTALLADGAFLHLSRNTVVEAPVQLLFVSVPGTQPHVTCPRVLIVAEACSQATIVEQHVTIGVGSGSGACLTNALTEIITHDDAVIDHYKVQGESDETWHYSAVQVAQLGRSNVTSHCFTLGGAITRNTVDAQLGAEGCDVTFNGLFLPRHQEQVDNHLRIDHLKPNCRSWQFYKGVLDDRARAVFSGRIYVAEDAQKTDAKQTNMNLLLSNTAHVDTKPQLEIFADDVKCTHGATIGQIEESQLFYLRTRGISPDAARSLLVHAFANETIQEVKVEPLRRQLEAELIERLPHGGLLAGGRL